MDGSAAITTLAFAAIPGVLVLEILEFGKPRLRERPGIRSIALYLIVSAFVWGLAALILDADGELASVIDSTRLSGDEQVTAYVALAWRLAATAIGFGTVCRLVLRAAEQTASKLAQSRYTSGQSIGGKVGDALIEVVSTPFVWDALMVRLRRRARAQVAHVRLRDGSDLYGILAAGGRADFQADGRGLVLDIELRNERGQLVEVPSSNGIFVAPEAMASVAFLDCEVDEGGGKVK